MKDKKKDKEKPVNLDDPVKVLEEVEKEHSVCSCDLCRGKGSVISTTIPKPSIPKEEKTFVSTSDLPHLHVQQARAKRDELKAKRRKSREEKRKKEKKDE